MNEDMEFSDTSIKALVSTLFIEIKSIILISLLSCEITRQFIYNNTSL